jgi:hypothetical protein
MKSENDRLKELFLAYAASRDAHGHKDCPSSTQMVNAFNPKASQRKKKRIVDHIVRCPDCRDEFGLLLKLQEVIDEADRAGDKGRVTRRSPHRLALTRAGHSPLWKYAYLFLGLVLIASVLNFFFREKDSSQINRTSATDVLLVYPTSSYRIPGKLNFRWREFPSSKHYVLELFDETLLPIWMSPPIDDTQAELPSEIRSKIKAGLNYYWMITAYSGAGKTGESKLVRFTVLKE